MEQLPALPEIEWPEPQEDGTTVVNAETHRKLFLLLGQLHNYIETQLARCAE